jgi:two-component system, OmpR family, sensor histidine kinase BaeS
VKGKQKMRSLAVKLTLAFILVGVAGVGLVAVVVRLYTLREFNKLVLDQNQQALLTNLTRFYEVNGSWTGVEQIFRSEGLEPLPIVRPELRWEARRALFVISDAEGKIVFGENTYLRSKQLTPRELRQGIEIQSKNVTVGWLIFLPVLDRWNPGTAEGDFLLGVQNAILGSAAAASLIALILGGILAFSLTKSLRELTHAAHELSRGKLGLQVAVRSEDELGSLAKAFNQMSADLAHSIDLRRKMTADIAHDLRTPLSVILGYTEALADGKLDPETEMFSIIHSEAQHLSHLIDDLKVLSLADAGELPLNLQHVAPEKLLRRTAEAYRVQAEKMGIKISVDHAQDLPEINVDVDRMAQVFGNLMSNAMRYTAHGGEIVLGARLNNAEVELSVADNGAGIPPEDIPNIFERSYRGDKARTRHNSESGLGLAIVKSLVEAQGGCITVDSILGEGARFRCSFPI